MKDDQSNTLEGAQPEQIQGRSILWLRLLAEALVFKPDF